MKKAIILCGGWDGHQPKLVSARFSKMLQNEGFTTEIIYDLKQFCKINLQGYDLIIPLWTMAKDKPVNNAVIKKISEAVFAGVGLASCHGGIIDAFRQSTEWQYMTGAQWVYHGEEREYKVKFANDEDVFTKGLNEFFVKGEQYYIHIDPAAKIHAYSVYPNSDFKTEGNGNYKMPVILTRNYGKGRVFVFTVGHQDHEFNIPEASEIMRRGFLWCVSEKIITKTLANYNEKMVKSIYEESIKTFRPVDLGNGKLKVAVIGCGNISGIYFTNLTKTFKNIEVIGCCDLIREKAEYAQKTYNLNKIYVKDTDVVQDPEVDIILNITYPKAHYDVCKLALTAGKHCYVEKPLALTIEQGKELVQIALKKDLYLGGAPDTFLGIGIQTAIKAIDKGLIGKPIAGTAFLTCRGHESWHPSPEFYYEFGGGPMLDMGPYYITALVSMLGPAEKVMGYANISFPEREITSAPKKGKIIKVETPTHISGLIKFRSGAIINIITSFDVYAANLPIIEIYGSEGTITVPDPNNFNGDVTINHLGKVVTKFNAKFPFMHNKKFTKINNVKGYSANSRGLGLSDMARAILEKDTARANCMLTCHVLDIMLGILESSKTGKEYILSTNCEKPRIL